MHLLDQFCDAECPICVGKPVQIYPEQIRVERPDMGRNVELGLPEHPQREIRDPDVVVVSLEIAGDACQADWVHLEFVR